ncbi:hypothetical protein [Adlercreutzia faecimuris]|uniref:Uncharacterized protein n=1 Tax=Adlercreutzia faecimuris TaxID=2897341 RepID=A0ABS9WE79_9ACTN|nr:hypothetical protein [Adlercreutzia sp. JBNU-10]MCI2241166.1 hypothetical protein [Adlercreutzia sp. JBNU-10]
MKNNKVYLPADALSRHDDFDILFEDGTPLYHVRGDWSSERGKVRFIGRMGGENCVIKPDAQTLSYYIQLERHEHALRTFRLFDHYYLEGRLWQIRGSLTTCPLDFVNEKTGRKEVHVSRRLFRGMGDAYEVRVTDVAKLRIAAAAVVALAKKEEWRGKSEGEKSPEGSRLARLREWALGGRGKTYEELLATDPAYAQQEAARLARLGEAR